MPRADAESFLGELVSGGVFIPSGVDGVYGRNEAFEQVMAALDALVTSETAADRPELVRFPPVVPKRTLERTGYLSSFPHLAGSIFTFAGGESEAVALAERARLHDDWTEFLAGSDLMLLPAACYPVYPWIAETGGVGEEGRLVDVLSYCFRHEPSRDPARLQMFRLHENVRVGTKEQVTTWHRDWISRGREFLTSIGLPAEAVVASDPFFGRGGKMLSATQVEREAKVELVFPIVGERPTAVLSVNYHETHFGGEYDIRTPAGELAHSACVGFGLDRIVLALFAEFGFDVRGWPEPVRRGLRLPDAAVPA